jgi:hypothetical protein
MHINRNIWLILLLTAYFSVSMNAQTTNPAAANKVVFQELKRSESAPQPPPALQHVTAELSGTLLGQSPNPSIEFVLTLQNNWSQDVKLLDPLDFLYLNLSTEGKSVAVPNGASRFTTHTVGEKKDLPYPSPISFRRIVRNSSVSKDKDEVITIPPGQKIEIVFESEPIVMELVMQALQTEAGERATSFKARATVALVNASAQPGVGGRLLRSDWVFLKVP